MLVMAFQAQRGQCAKLIIRAGSHCGSDHPVHKAFTQSSLWPDFPCREQNSHTNTWVQVSASNALFPSAAAGFVWAQTLLLGTERLEEADQ